MRHDGAAIICVLAISASCLAADNWPAWRGPHGNGVSKESDAPVHWTATEGVRWKVSLPGRGSGSPVIWGDRVLLSASEGHRQDQLHFLCLDRRSGRELWHRRFWGTAPTLYHEQKSSMATPTPVTDG